MMTEVVNYTPFTKDFGIDFGTMVVKKNRGMLLQNSFWLQIKPLYVNHRLSHTTHFVSEGFFRRPEAGLVLPP